MPCIKTTNLVLSYDDKIIVNNCNIEIPKGKITTIIGPNGCGKSTILKSIGRILKPKAGRIFLNDKPLVTLDTKEIAKQMAILPQTPSAPGGITVSEIISYGRFPYQKGFGNLAPEDRKIIDWAIEVTNLKEFAKRSIDSLSGGQRQRVWIAMALAQQTDIILLDEPTTYLDLCNQLEILNLLYDLNQKYNTTIVMVLHDLNLAARFADYIIAVKDGVIVNDGTAAEVMTHDTLEKVFGIDAELATDPRTGRPICISYDVERCAAV